MHVIARLRPRYLHAPSQSQEIWQRLRLEADQWGCSDCRGCSEAPNYGSETSERPSGSRGKQNPCQTPGAFNVISKWLR